MKCGKDLAERNPRGNRVQKIAYSLVVKGRGRWNESYRHKWDFILREADWVSEEKEQEEERQGKDSGYDG